MSEVLLTDICPVIKMYKEFLDNYSYECLLENLLVYNHYIVVGSLWNGTMWG